jgi:hypothetical protein
MKVEPMSELIVKIHERYRHHYEAYFKTLCLFTLQEIFALD